MSRTVTTTAARWLLRSLLAATLIGCGGESADATHSEVAPEPPPPPPPALVLAAARHTEPLETTRHVVVIEDELHLVEALPATNAIDGDLALVDPRAGASMTLEQLAETLRVDDGEAAGGGMVGEPIGGGSFGFGIPSGDEDDDDRTIGTPPGADPPPSPLPQVQAAEAAAIEPAQPLPALFVDRGARFGRVIGAARSLCVDDLIGFCPPLAVAHDGAVAAVSMSSCAGRVTPRAVVLEVTSALTPEEVAETVRALHEANDPGRALLTLVVEGDVTLGHALAIRDAAIDAGVFRRVSLTAVPWSMRPGAE